MNRRLHRDFAPRIRRKDPFSPYLGYRKRIKRDRAILAGVVLMLVFFLYRAITQRGTYAIKVDGKALVYVSGKKNAGKVVWQIQQLAEGKGKLREKLAIEKIKGKRQAQSPEEAYKILKAKVHILTPAYLFKKGGKIAFAVEDRESFNAFLEEYKVSFCRRLVSPPFEAKYREFFELKPTIIESSRIKKLSTIQSVFFSPDRPLLTVVCKKRVVKTEDIPFTTETVKDPSMYSDIRVILQEGVPGKKETELLMIYENGKVVSKKVISEKILFAPIPKRVKVGTRLKPRG